MKFSNVLTVFVDTFKKCIATPERILLYVVLPVAVVAVFVLPPFQAPDEHTHFFKAVQISEFKLHGQRMQDPSNPSVIWVGDYLPARYKETADHYIGMRIHTTETVNLRQLKDDLTKPILKNNLIATPFENTVVYQPIAYFPQAIAVFTTNLVTGNVLVQLYMARLASLAAAFILLYLAVKRIPFGKWPLLIFSSTPLMIALLASTSGDAITIGLSALFIAEVLVVLQNKKPINKAAIISLIVLAAALALCKTPYFLIAFFVCIIPMKKFGDRKRYLTFIALCTLAPLIIAGLWSLFIKDILINVAPGSNTASQTHFLLTNPLTLPEVLIRTYVGDIGSLVPQSMIDLSVGFAMPFAIWFIILTYVLIILSIVGDKLYIDKRIREKKARTAAAAIGVGGFIVINTLLYLTFTPVGFPRIDGLQGRYFIPFALMAIPALTGLFVVNSEQYRKLTIILRIFVAVSTLTALLVLFKRYY